jgi:hypothetical protein
VDVVLFFLVYVLPYIFFPVLFAMFSGSLARARGRSYAKWWAAGLFFGPLGLVVGLFPSVDSSQPN